MPSVAQQARQHQVEGVAASSCRRRRGRTCGRRRSSPARDRRTRPRPAPARRRRCAPARSAICRRRRPLRHPATFGRPGKGDAAVAAVRQRLDRVVQIPDVDVEPGLAEVLRDVGLRLRLGPSGLGRRTSSATVSISSSSRRSISSQSRSTAVCVVSSAVNVSSRSLTSPYQRSLPIIGERTSPMTCAPGLTLPEAEVVFRTSDQTESSALATLLMGYPGRPSARIRRDGLERQAPSRRSDGARVLRADQAPAAEAFDGGGTT